MLTKKKITPFILIIFLGCSKTNDSATEVKSIADDLYSVMLEDRIDLKMKFGLPINYFYQRNN